MIDINELRRLAQAATPGPWINHGRQPNVAGLPHSAVAAKTLLARVYSEAYGDVEQETANASFIAAANPATISELLDRLEAVEKERDAARKITDSLALALNTSNHKRYALRTKIEAMEKQEPVEWQTRTRPAWNDGTWGPWRKCSEEYAEDIKKTPLLHDWLYEARALYALPGAQPTPSVPDGFSREDLEAVADGLDGYEKTVNVGNVTGEGDDHLESTTAYAARFIRTMLAATPETKP